MWGYKRRLKVERDRGNMGSSQRMLLAVLGIAVNVLLAFITNKVGFLLFFDTIGTVCVTAVGGVLPGIFTAVFTNVICTAFDKHAIYFGFLNAFVAISFHWFLKKRSLKKVKDVISFILIISLITGSVSFLIHWFLLDGVQSSIYSDTVLSFASSVHIPVILGSFIVGMIMNLIDKGISIGVVILLLRIIPHKKLEEIKEKSWGQRPLSAEEIAELEGWGKNIRLDIRKKITITILSVSILLVVVTGFIGVSLYFNNLDKEKTTDAQNMLRLVSEVVEPEKLRKFMVFGDTAPGYKETEILLKHIKENVGAVEKMRLIRFEMNGGYIIFDISDEGLGSNDRVEYTGKMEAYKSRLIAGKDIEPIEHSDISGLMRSVYFPIRDKDGKCICYAVADISITYMTDYMRIFIIRSVLVLMGFFILVIAQGMAISNTAIVYPIRSMAKCIDGFTELGYDQEQLDENVRSIRRLDIHTGDEVEMLYHSICEMTLNLSEQVRELRHLTDITVKMQDGLIITMADMVENRDSDTGAHIQKTAAYVKIILDGLKKKGYYTEKITPKFESDVVSSAPLHDIGKINISDRILNKPGELTDDEYEIMKTHTTVGKKIMENAISTVRGENYLKEARNMAAYHHERWDGTGYPEGLHGEVIPLSARIMAVADVFDALTSPRVYKEAFSVDEAVAMLEEGAGSQFDPKCVEAFMDSLPEVKMVLKRFSCSMKER